MEQNSFWLACLGQDTLSVSLITKDKTYEVTATGPETAYTEDADSLIAATDQSLSAAADSISLPPEKESDSVALIISPFWVGLDGKIVADKLKLLDALFKKLKLKPMGFISLDEAIVEEANQTDGFPASFVLVNLGEKSFTVSVAYLGKISQRINKPFNRPFSPEMLESALLSLNSDSTLPPQIILIGRTTPDIIENLRSFPWIGKKNVETFLHFPDIRAYSAAELTGIYMTVITSQFQPPPPSKIAEENVDELMTPEAFSESETELISADSPGLDEVSADELGFSSADNFTVPGISPEDLTVPDDEILKPEPEPAPVATPRTKIKFSFPRLSLPKFRVTLPGSRLWLMLLAILPLLILVPFYFSSAQIILYLTPYNFQKSLNVTFDPAAAGIDLSKNIIPINRQNYDVTSSASAPTSGQKTIGDKAQGEITVFNKQDKVQNLAKGAVISDGSGHKFDLGNAAQVASSSADLVNGVITLGQTKIMVVAEEIGPEYNLPKDTLLHFKDFPDTSLIARVGQGLGGGTKRQINAVSAADKSAVDEKLTAEASSSLNDQIAKESSDRPSIIRELTQVKKGRVDYNREVGEEADELTGTVTSTVYVFFFSSDQKREIINKLFASEPGFAGLTVNPDNFSFTVTSVKGATDRPQAVLSVTGTVLPAVDTTALTKMVAGKSRTTAINLIRRALPRVYNYQISTNFTFLQAVNPLPFRLTNIKFDIK